jgi:hypothetical protein
LQELGQGTVDWVANFDGTLNEPSLLPSRLPHILLNNTTGIAVGMATDIPPHNLVEVGNAATHLLDKPKAKLDDILQYVRIVGEAKEDPLTGKIASIKIHDIERLEDRGDEGANLLPQGTPISRDFWQSPTLDELAQAQNVKLMANVRALFGTWPGEMNDGFEQVIDELRHSQTGRGELP